MPCRHCIVKVGDLTNLATETVSMVADSFCLSHRSRRSVECFTATFSTFAALSDVSEGVRVLFADERSECQSGDPALVLERDSGLATRFMMCLHQFVSAFFAAQSPQLLTNTLGFGGKGRWKANMQPRGKAFRARPSISEAEGSCQRSDKRQILSGRRSLLAPCMACHLPGKFLYTLHSGSFELVRCRLAVLDLFIGNTMRCRRGSVSFPRLTHYHVGLMENRCPIACGHSEKA